MGSYESTRKVVAALAVKPHDVVFPLVPNHNIVRLYVFRKFLDPIFYDVGSRRSEEARPIFVQRSGSLMGQGGYLLRLVALAWAGSIITLS